MTSTALDDLPMIDPNQLGKAVTANTAFGSIEQAFGGPLSINVNASGFASPYTIPYQSGDEPAKTKTALRFYDLVVSGSLSADWIAYMPAGKNKPFLVTNNTTGGHNVVILVQGQTGVTVPVGQTFLCYLNGTDVVQRAVAAAAGSQPWEVGNFINGQPGGGQVVMRFIAGRTITFAADFANNQMKAGTAAGGTSTFNVNKNGSLVGTAVFTGGLSVATWSSVGHLPIVYNAGDVGTFIAPNPADASLADIAWNLVGSR